jgi:hypothetical protein
VTKFIVFMCLVEAGEAEYSEVLKSTKRVDSSPKTRKTGTIRAPLFIMPSDQPKSGLRDKVALVTSRVHSEGCR